MSTLVINRKLCLDEVFLTTTKERVWYDRVLTIQELTLQR